MRGSAGQAQPQQAPNGAQGSLGSRIREQLPGRGLGCFVYGRSVLEPDDKPVAARARMMARNPIMGRELSVPS
jgi:hypothetical protein